MLDDYLYSYHYYQKKVNLDPERCQINLERAIRRKHRESQATIACQHNKDDWCRIRNIPFQELDDFHDCYWNCNGTVNKRVFVAQYLTVQPVCNEESKKDLNITCYCPRKNGEKDLICQKSFISVLGVSKHKVLAIGRAKLLNGEQLFKETRGGKRWKNKSNNNSDKWDLESSTIDSNQSDKSNSNRQSNKNNNDNNDNDDTEEKNDDNSDNEQPTTELYEPDRNMNESFNNESKKMIKNENDDSSDSDIEICSPTLPTIHIEESQYDSSSDDNTRRDDGNMFMPDIEMNETESILSDKPPLRQQPVYSQSRLEQRNEIYIRKKTQQLPHLIRQFNTKTTARSGSVMVRPQKYEIVKIKINNNNNGQLKQNDSQQQQCTTITPTTNKQYLGPVNWKRTVERNQRRLQREQEVSISCTHNMTRFCKIQNIPKQDLIHFHQEYWFCNGIVEERIFLARYLIVTPRSHRREMTIVHRIPTIDGNLYEVCQKSFLSVVGITKHKVQAAARAVLRGELFKKDGRGGSKIKRLRNIQEQSIIEDNNDEEEYDDDDNNDELMSDRDTSNYSSPTKDCTLQIAQVIGNYNPGMNGEFNIEIKSEPAIEIHEYNDNSNFMNHSVIEDNNFHGSNGNEENSNHEQISNNKNNDYKKNMLIKDEFNSTNELKIDKIKRNLTYFKRKSKRLINDKKRLLNIISHLRMENIRLKNIKKK